MLRFLGNAKPALSSSRAADSRKRRARKRCRPVLEPLEGRELLTILTEATSLFARASYLKATIFGPPVSGETPPYSVTTGEAVFNTSMPAGITSCPMPSPAITAIR